MGCVYLARNKDNGKVYVGKTVKTLRERRNIHHFHAAKGENGQKYFYFQKAIAKHGREQFEWIILFKSGDDKELCLWEEYFIEQYNSCDPSKGYNLSYGGESGSPSEETREKLRETAKEVGTRPEVKKARSEIRNRMLSTEEGRRKHAEAIRAACRKPEWQEKHKKVLEYVRSPEIREKINRKLRELSKNPEWIENNKKVLEIAHDAAVKPIVCLDNDIIYHGTLDAHRRLGVVASRVTQVCKGKTKTSMGFKFRYATPEEVDAYRSLRAELGKEGEITIHMLDIKDTAG